MSVVAELGSVGIVQRTIGTDQRCARFVWKTDASAYAVRVIPFPIEGTLLRFATYMHAQDPAYPGDYDARLYDQWGVDQFGGLCDGLDPDGNDAGELYLALGTDRRRPLVVCGELTFSIGRDGIPAELDGVFELYWSAVVQRPDTRGVH